MKKIKQSMVALRAATLALVAFVTLFCIAPMTAFAASGLDGKAAEEPVTRAATGGLSFLEGALIVALGLVAVGVIIYLIWRNGKKHKEEIAKAGLIGGDGIATSLGLGRNAANNQYGLFTPVVPVVPQTGTAVPYGALNQQQAAAPVANNPYFQQPPAPVQPQQPQPPQNNNPWR